MLKVGITGEITTSPLSDILNRDFLEVLMQIRGTATSTALEIARSLVAVQRGAPVGVLLAVEVLVRFKTRIGGIAELPGLLIGNVAGTRPVAALRMIVRGHVLSVPRPERICALGSRRGLNRARAR